MEHRTAAKEWRMAELSFRKKREQHNHLKSAQGNSQRETRQGVANPLPRSGQWPNLARRLGAQTYDVMENKRTHILLPRDLEGQPCPLAVKEIPARFAKSAKERR